MRDRPVRLLVVLPALVLFAAALNYGVVSATLAALPPSLGATAEQAVYLARQESALAVRGDHLVGPTSAEAALVWARFVEVVPAEHRSTVAAFSVFDGGDVDAYVEQLRDDPSGWHLAVNEALASQGHLLDRTLIHELGHLISFHPEQVPPAGDDRAWHQAARDCATYLAKEGCSAADSYLNRFVEEFWAEELLPEWQGIADIDDDEHRMGAIEAFAAAHRASFVTSYAATNPEEDLAESFATYVLTDAGGLEGSIGERVRFFAQFPELEELREAIRARL